MRTSFAFLAGMAAAAVTVAVVDRLLNPEEYRAPDPSVGTRSSLADAFEVERC